MLIVSNNIEIAPGTLTNTFDTQHETLKFGGTLQENEQISLTYL